MSSEERLPQVELGQMLDRERLYELVTRYCRAIDRADEELLLSCYHPDATQDHGAYKGPIPGLVAHLQGRALDPAKGALQHVVSNCRFELDGDIAHGESYLRTVMTDPEGEWRIAHRQVIIDVPRAGMDTAPFVRGYRDRRDPSYRNR
jgi:hypothetical protein